MKIGLFFGSFNPTHIGHIGLAKAFLTELDEVWLVVSPQNPLKTNADLWADEFRLELAKKATANIPNIKVCDVEFTLPKPSYTYNTLQALRAQYPEHSFVLLIGADNVLLFDKWRNYQEILRDFEVWAYPRLKCDISKDIFPEIRRIDAPLYNISATEIRQRLAQNLPIEGLVPSEILSDILAFYNKSVFVANIANTHQPKE